MKVAMAYIAAATAVLYHASAASLSKKGSIVLDKSTGSLSYVDGQLVDGAVARGVYTDMTDRPTSMFGELTIRTSGLSGAANDTTQARASGLLEGHLTATRMHQHYDNWMGWLVKNGIPHDNGSIPEKFYTWFG